MVMDINEIREYLPHRYPFLLVDRVTQLTTGESIVAYKNVSINEPFFNGHFPDLPIMPGVLINKLPADGYVYYLVGSDKVRFKRPVMPGDKLTLEADVIRGKRGIWKFACRATVDGELACEAEIICAERKVA